MKKKKTEKINCKLIQWGKLHTVNGKPACPECGKDAEMIIGIIGQPCWGHKIK